MDKIDLYYCFLSPPLAIFCILPVLMALLIVVVTLTTEA